MYVNEEHRGHLLCRMMHHFETFPCACWSIVFHVLGYKGVALKQCKDTNDCLKRLTYSRALEPGNHLCHFKLWNINLRAQGLKISFWVSVNDRSLLDGSWPVFSTTDQISEQHASRSGSVGCFIYLFIFNLYLFIWLWNRSDESKQTAHEEGKHRRLFWLLRFEKYWLLPPTAMESISSHVGTEHTC